MNPVRIRKTITLTASTSMKYLCRNYDKHTRHISKIYTILHSGTSKLPYMGKWEQALGETMAAEEWGKLAQYNSRCINTSLIEANYKGFLRWYMAPVWLASCVPGASSSCYRGCGQKGMIVNTWWTWPKVKRFWIHTYNFIYSLTQISLIKAPQQALLRRPLQGKCWHMRR